MSLTHLIIFPALLRNIKIFITKHNIIDQLIHLITLTNIDNFLRQYLFRLPRK